mmetsp:Transcript_8618/g.14613  ORF Transcript_8618/g.14613 Transcript_8618/m.14613 type:complete len:91 (+) Transcript_8618:121-393(+)
MGRRKAALKKTLKKKKPTVPTVFKCPFCHHDDAVECKLDMKVKLGTITCRMCNVSYQSQINYLTDPIDVFCEWIDSAADAQLHRDQQDES